MPQQKSPGMSPPPPQQQQPHMARARATARARRESIMRRTSRWTLRCRRQERMEIRRGRRRVALWLQKVDNLQVWEGRRVLALVKAMGRRGAMLVPTPKTYPQTRTSPAPRLLLQTYPPSQHSLHSLQNDAKMLLVTQRIAITRMPPRQARRERGVRTTPCRPPIMRVNPT